MQIAIDQTTLYTLIKKAVKEAIEEEEYKLFLAHIPEVSDEEMQEIERIHGKPGEKDVAHSVTVQT
ncbi:hypothetical protein J7L68_05120 [bacterium]|nr:hypothetical protein [bacterium]